jgi:hypothetical protein
MHQQRRAVSTAKSSSWRDTRHESLPSVIGYQKPANLREVPFPASMTNEEANAWIERWWAEMPEAKLEIIEGRLIISSLEGEPAHSLDFAARLRTAEGSAVGAPRALVGGSGSWRRPSGIGSCCELLADRTRRGPIVVEASSRSHRRGMRHERPRLRHYEAQTGLAQPSMRHKEGRLRHEPTSLRRQGSRLRRKPGGLRHRRRVMRHSGARMRRQETWMRHRNVRMSSPNRDISVSDRLWSVSSSLSQRLITALSCLNTAP